jgi:hypothetical protein
MRKRVGALLALTTTVTGLAAGTTPAHATPKADAAVGYAYSLRISAGDYMVLKSGELCQSIVFPTERGRPALSAQNFSDTSTITFYSESFGPICHGESYTLEPGKSAIFPEGMYFYSST